MWLVLAACAGFDGQLSSLTLDSEILDDTLHLTVLAPLAPPSTDAGYPVVVVLDGDWLFPPVAREVERVQQDRPAVVVGVDYAGENHRLRDFTPTADPEFPSSGGLDAYLAFLREELLPRIEEDLPLSPERDDRALVGFSLGGLCAVMALLREEETFGAYGAGSPSLWWDDGIAFDEEVLWVPRFSSRIFLSMGALESAGLMNAPFDAMVARLQSHEALDVESTRFGGRSHMSSSAPAGRAAVDFFLGAP